MINIENRVCAIIVSYNDPSALSLNLDALKNQVEMIIVVDNGSREPTQKYLAGLIQNSKIHLLRLDENLGVGKALNEGVKIAQLRGFDWILTLDQDSRPCDNMVEKLLVGAHSHAKNKVGIIAPRLVSKTQKNKIASDRILSYSITSGNLINTNLYNSIGYYNEKYFIDSVDFDFSLRVREGGYSIVEIGGACLIHDIGSHEGGNWISRVLGLTLHSPLRRYYMIRNHFFLTKQFWNKFPYLIAKKNISLIVLLFKIFIFERQRCENVRMVKLGLVDYLKNKGGKFV